MRTCVVNNKYFPAFFGNLFPAGFGSKKPASNPKPIVNGFIYGDFGTFNSFASENKLGGTPIYLLGTIKSVEKFAITGDIYYAAFLIDDFEGYQWVGSMDVPKNTFDTFKTIYTGMTAYIYGAYDGYSIDRWDGRYVHY